MCRWGKRRAHAHPPRQISALMVGHGDGAWLSSSGGGSGSTISAPMVGHGSAAQPGPKPGRSEGSDGLELCHSTEVATQSCTPSYTPTVSTCVAYAKKHDQGFTSQFCSLGMAPCLRALTTTLLTIASTGSKDLR